MKPRMYTHVTTVAAIGIPFATAPGISAKCAESWPRKIGAIAAKTGASAGEVGTERAKQIAQTSKPGVWLQRDNGEWYRK